uniref:Uncharacterized protein n=1 Tax=Oryza brachyantha TaxID=4533 RepID=J3L4D6_ORYBR
MKHPSSSSRVACLLLVCCSLMLPAVASAVTITPSETTTGAKTTTAPAAMPDEEFLARLCDQQHSPMRRRLPWCQQLHARPRRHGGAIGGGERWVPMPPPSRDGEVIDVRYGVSKRLVPTGPNPLHN